MWTIWPNSSKSSHIQQNTSHVKNPTEFLPPIFYQKCVTCKKFDRICHLWGIRSNTLQLWNYGKIDLIRHTVVTYLTENITYEKYVPLSHTYNSPKCVTCNTSDQIYLARDKFDRKLPCCKNNSTELFIVVTYLTKYMTCEKSDRISHTYISPKMFPFIKILFTGVQAIENLMCDKLVWVKNSKSAKRILHLCPNVINSVEFIAPAWGIRSVRNTVQQSRTPFSKIPQRSQWFQKKWNIICTMVNYRETSACPLFIFLAAICSFCGCLIVFVRLYVCCWGFHVDLLVSSFHLFTSFTGWEIQSSNRNTEL